MKQARTTLITKGLFHLLQCVRTCPSFLHGTEDKTQTAKSGLATSFLVRFVKLYRYWFSINMASSSADNTSFFKALTIVTLELLWSSLALHITTTTQHSFFRASRAIATYQRITSKRYLTYDQLPRLASYAVYSHLSYICNRWHGRDTKTLIIP